MTPNSILLSWLASVERSDAAGYLPTDLALLPADVQAALTHWGRQILVPAANPYLLAAGAQHAVHLSTKTTNDLVRSVHEALGVSLTVIQSLTFVLVRVTPATPAPDDAAALVHTLAALLLVPESRGPQGSFEPAETTDRGPIFSSCPGADPMILDDWRARIDAGVRDGEPFFFFYKKDPRFLGYASGAEHWFDEHFRESVATAGRS